MNSKYVTYVDESSIVLLQVWPIGLQAKPDSLLKVTIKLVGMIDDPVTKRKNL